MTNPVLSVTALEIIKKALRLINELDASQEPEDTDVIDALEALNYMVKHWQAQNLHLWTKTEGVLFLQVGKTDYLLGPSGDEAANLDDTVFPTVSIDAVATDRTIFLSDTTGISGAEDQFAYDPATTTQDWTVNDGTIDASTGSLVLTNGTSVACDIDRDLEDLTVDTTYQVFIDYTLGTSSGTIFEVFDGTTSLGSVTLSATGTGFLEFTATEETLTLSVINSSTATGETSQVNSIQLNDETTGSYIGIELDDGSRQWSQVVNVNSTTEVYIADELTDSSTADNTAPSFTELIDRPVNVLDLRRSKTTTDNQEIQAIKWSRQQYFAQPSKSSQGTINNWYYSPQLTDGRMYLWQTAQNVDQLAKFTFLRPIEITEETSENPDFPSEWFLVLSYNLAYQIGPEYRLPDARLAALKTIADQMLDEALGFDREQDNLNMMPDFRGIGGGYA